MSHGEVCALGEAGMQPHGASLRVFGTIKSFDANEGRCVITEAGSELVVDTRHITGAMPLMPGRTVQFIGEVERNRDAVMLVPRVVRPFDGVDTVTYMEIVRRQRISRHPTAALLTTVCRDSSHPFPWSILNTPSPCMGWQPQLKHLTSAPARLLSQKSCPAKSQLTLSVGGMFACRYPQHPSPVPARSYRPVLHPLAIFCRSRRYPVSTAACVLVLPPQARSLMPAPIDVDMRRVVRAQEWHDRCCRRINRLKPHIRLV